MDVHVFSQLVEDYVTEYPFLRSDKALSVIDIIMPLIRQLTTPYDGWSAYCYTASIREITMDG